MGVYGKGVMGGYEKKSNHLKPHIQIRGHLKRSCDSLPVDSRITDDICPQKDSLAKYQDNGISSSKDRPSHRISDSRWESMGKLVSNQTQHTRTLQNEDIYMQIICMW